MTRFRVLTGTVVLVAALAACGTSSNPVGGSSDTAGPAAGSAAGSASGSATGGSLVVGSANFPESVLLAEIYAGALQAKGVQVTKKLNIGSREAYIPGLQDGSIDLIPEYTGNLLTYFDKSSTATSSQDIYAALPQAVPSTLKVLDQAAAEDKDAIVVTKETADKYKLASIADLAPVAKDLVLGAPPEFETRRDGVPGLKAKYGVTFKQFRKLDTGGPLTVAALKNGQVQAANIFTTDPSIAANGWIALADPKTLYTAQNVVPLINAGKASESVTSALNGVSGKLDTSTLTELVAKVVTDKEDPASVASEWLKSNNLA
jgi:osmoprotectant transport system substrate-binding protein